MRFRLLLFTPLLLVCFTADSVQCIQCIFDLWDDDRQPTTIHPITLSCLEGSIRWNWVRSAIYAKLSEELAGSRLCLQITANHTSVAATHFQRKTQKGRSVAEDSKPIEVCWVFGNGSIALVEPENPWKHQPPQSKVYVRYTVEKMARESSIDSCQPCSGAEFLELYCAGDFAAIGSVTGAFLFPPSSESYRLQVHLDRVRHQSSPVFTRPQDDSQSFLVGSVHIPAKCVDRPDQIMLGEKRVFTGRIRFDKAYLLCSITLKEYDSLALRSAGSIGGSPLCTLR